MGSSFYEGHWFKPKLACMRLETFGEKEKGRGGRRKGELAGAAKRELHSEQQHREQDNCSLSSLNSFPRWKLLCLSQGKRRPGDGQQGLPQQRLTVLHHPPTSSLPGQKICGFWVSTHGRHWAKPPGPSLPSWAESISQNVCWELVLSTSIYRAGPVKIFRFSGMQ